MNITLEDINLLPHRKHKTDAGHDLKSNEETFTLKPKETKLVHTGVRIEISYGFCGMVVPRSGLGCQGLNLMNGVGIIDSNYRGEIMVKVINNGSKDIKIKQFDRFCQLIIVPVSTEALVTVPQLSESPRGENGFGSSGC